MSVIDEPIYEFIKGKGWVIAPRVKSVSREFVKEGVRYLVTVYDRKPEVGERATNRVTRFANKCAI